MSEAEEDATPRYAVVAGDRYAAERDATAFSLAYAVGLDYSERWAARLKETVEGLAGFPGPLSHARDEEASALAGREVRRLLYYGPTRRRSGTPARVLFTVLPPAADDPDGEAVILLLRLLHGPQTLLAPKDAP